MEIETTSVDGLVEEYRTLCYPYFDARADIPWNRIERCLARGGEWTPSGAKHITNLARQYGSFMLRNALALAVAAGVEDSELGF
jgi:hypothetical protein